ncbi:hypothetical protein [Streptomyces sp. NPDC046385]|uniref:hypothetical protein n=1 Tax=Streptomyces sp. NPDC046385 TaxID=3154918 RepID=UPI0033C4420B
MLNPLPLLLASWQHAPMSWQMTLEYIRTLIWPAVVLVLGFTFRRQLGSLFSRVESLETPVGTIAFERQLRAVEQEAVEIESEIATEVAAVVQSENSHQREEGDSPSEDVIDGQITESSTRQRNPVDSFSGLFDLVESETTAAVLGAWREVEKAIWKASGEARPVALSSERLARIGLLSPELLRSVEDLRQLRNRVVHEGDIVLTESGARSYVSAAQRIVDALSLSSSPVFLAHRYEERVLSCLSEFGLGIEKGYADTGFDAVYETLMGGHVVVQVKHRRNGQILMRDIQNVLNRLPDFASGVLVITNAPLSREIREFNAKSHESRPRVEVIQWQSSEDDDVLVRALARISH